MLETSFYLQTCISFVFVVLGAYGLFFARSFKMLTASGILTLIAVSFQILATDFFRSVFTGQIAIFFLWLFFLLQVVCFRFFLSTKEKLYPLFYGIAFLAFITMSVSLDLLTFLFGLILFSLSFVGLFAFRGVDKEKLLASIQKNLISFFCFAYGLALLYMREATFQIKDLYLKLRMLLSTGGSDDLIFLGFSFLFLSIAIDLFAIFLLIGRKK